MAAAENATDIASSMSRYIWSAFLVIALSGCTVWRAEAPDRRQSERFLTLEPASLGRSLSLSQLVIGEYQNRTYRMRYEVEITPKRLAIVGVSPLGVTLFTIVQEGGDTAIETPTKDNFPFDPRYILFDVYLTYWPGKVLKAPLASLDMQLDEDAQASMRRLSSAAGNRIAEIMYPKENEKKGETIIQHFDRPYTLRIVTLRNGSGQ